MATERQKSIARNLTLLIPRVPYLDAEAIRTAAGSRHMKSLSPASAVWLATLAHIRHQHTDYDELRDEGYEKDEARFFVVEAINEVLDRWGATRHLVSEADEDEGWDDKDGEPGEDASEDASPPLPPKARPRPDAD
ncbi:DUF2293 domain-containing protein [Aureimonas sp. N4]|uniref:DUF2293 domain-containing protein n=1 Tax=Aureimonas sp. N4 TaxID=1638165 RepID=UPI0007866789|nr:DUF2293 domain-containing protein [Aureimonas sp. N4]